MAPARTNPATGLPMTGAVDVAGNPYGVELARQLRVPVNRVTSILNGQRGDTALRLGRFFGTSGEFWLNLQKLYELRLAEAERGTEIASLPVFDAERWRHDRGSVQPVLV